MKAVGNMQNQNFIKEFNREINTLVQLKHVNLVRFEGACVDKNLCIITEFCSGRTLFELLHQQRHIKLSRQQKFKLIRDMSYAMLYLHTTNPPVIHRDLKSLNLLLLNEIKGPNDLPMLKITDFGLAK